MKAIDILLSFRYARPRSIVGSTSDSSARGPGLLWHYGANFIERGPMFGTQSGNILSFLLPLIQEGQLSVTGNYVHKVLINRLEGLSLPRKSVVRLTDHPDMTLAV